MHIIYISQGKVLPVLSGNQLARLSFTAEGQACRGSVGGAEIFFFGLNRVQYLAWYLEHCSGTLRIVNSSLVASRSVSGLENVEVSFWEGDRSR